MLGTVLGSAHELHLFFTTELSESFSRWENRFREITPQIISRLSSIQIPPVAFHPTQPSWPTTAEPIPELLATPFPLHSLHSHSLFFEHTSMFLQIPWPEMFYHLICQVPRHLVHTTFSESLKSYPPLHYPHPLFPFSLQLYHYLISFTWSLTTKMRPGN